MQDPMNMEPEEEPASGFQLRDVWAIIQMQRGIVLLGLLVCVITSMVYAVTATRHYEARSVVHISTIANLEMEMGKSVENANLVWNRDLYIRTMISLVQSRSFRHRIIERYLELYPDDELLGSESKGVSLLARATDIKPRKGTELLDILVTTTNPELSARLANLTAQVLREDRLEQFTQAAEGAKGWLEGQLEVYEKRIAEASAELLQYQRDNNMIDVEDDQTTLDAQVSSLNAAYAKANAERVEQETLVRSYERLIERGKYDELAKSMQSPVIGMLLSQYVNARQNAVELAQVYGPKWPARRYAEQEMERIEQQLREEVLRALSTEKALLEVLTAKEENLEAAIGGSKRDKLEVLSHYEGYEKKLLDLDTARSLYGRMKERRGELELQSKTQLNNVRIIETARPPAAAASPNVMMTLVGGLVGGLILGVGGAFAREWLDDTITSPLDVSTYLRVPLLGMIPKIPEDIDDEQNRTLFTHLNPRSNVAEAARALRTVVELNPTGRCPRRLLVTSALSSEGKTSTAMRLGIAFANAHKRVAIIDCDFRRPRIHKVFKDERTPGFSDALMGTAQVQEILRPTGVPNLTYIAAGSSSDEANEAIAGASLPGVLDQIEAIFDLIIIDSPPSLLISDARLLSRHVDGVIVMARERATSRSLVREGITGIQQVGGHIYGVVINEIDVQRSGGGYHYGYGYQYKYQYYDDDRTAAK